MEVMRFAVKKEVMNDRFVHLHSHSEYSALDGLCRVSKGSLSIRGRETRGETLVERAAQYGMPACALTDHGTLGGYYRFARECSDRGLKPIVGVEFYVARDRLSKTAADRFEEDHLVVLARDWGGLQALFRLVTSSYLEGFYQRPRTDLASIVAEAPNGLIGLSGCVSSRLARLIVGGESTGGRREAKGYVSEMLDAFGGRFHVEVQPHSFDRQTNHNLACVDVARECGARLVATNDLHYVRPEHSRTHDVMLCIQTAARVDDADRFRFTGDGYHVRTRAEMRRGLIAQGLRPADVEAALDATLEIAESVDMEIPTMEGIVPLSGSSAPRRDLEESCREGYRRLEREGLLPEGASRTEYRARWRRELDVIEQMGYLDYFVIVRDLYRWVEEQGIVRGPGRGSVGGSLVAYLLDITQVDPIEHGLDFERFINPARGRRPPDIDMDFQDDRRQEVLDWFKRRFGEQNFAHIGTWSTIQGKGAFRDVARAFGVPLREVDEAANLVGPTIAESDLGAFAERWPEVVEHALELEDVVRQRGVHASGIVVSPRLREFVPLELKVGKVVTALTGKEMEDAGFIKFDVLGLSVLRALAITMDEIQRHRGRRVDPRKIPWRDPDCLATFREGRVAGIFEFDTLGAARECRKMRFESFSDVAVMGALLRPGAMSSGQAEVFFGRRRGERAAPEVHPAFDEVTRETHGVVVYDEQVSALFRKLAGFSPERADEARVVVAKSQGGEKFELFRAEFVSGAESSGMDRGRADAMFDDLVAFGGYAFNKAHSTAYGRLAFQTAWLRHHYPEEFWTGRLSAAQSKELAAEYVHEARKAGVRLLAPCVSNSGFMYRTERIAAGAAREGDEFAVRVGFVHVSGVGARASREVEGKQPFASLDDFLERVDRRVVTRSVFEALILSGAMRSLEPNTRALHESLAGIYESRGRGKRGRPGRGQTTLLFEEEESRFSRMPAWTESQEGRRRLKVLPLPFAGDPLDYYRREMRRMGHLEFAPIDSIYDPEGPASTAFVRGLVTDCWTDDRKGRGMVLDANIQDETASARFRFRGEAFRRYAGDRAGLAGSVVVVGAQPFRQSSMWFAEHVVRLDDLAESQFGRWLTSPEGGWDPSGGEDPLAGVRPIDRARVGRVRRGVGRIVSARVVRTRKDGRRMAFATVLGAAGCVEVVVWPDSFGRIRKELEVGARVLVRGQVDERGFKIDVREGHFIRKIQD